VPRNYVWIPDITLYDKYVDGLRWLYNELPKYNVLFVLDVFDDKHSRATDDVFQK